MNSKSNYTWCYYKLMLGNYGWAFDHLLLKIAQIIEDTHQKEWFFLRFTDEDGPHMRLRLRVKSTQFKVFDREIYQKLHDIILQLPRLTLEELPRLVTVTMPDFNQTDLTRFAFGVKRAEYKPEDNIYGGENGTPIAEHLFQVSSEIAVDAIREERNGTVSRKDLAPALMNATLEEFQMSKPASDFLASYVNYWASGIPDSGKYIATFEDKFRKLMESDIPIVCSDDKYNPLLSELLQKWRRSLRDTQAAYKKTDEYSEVLVERLTFYFIHLMNNRLGFTALDEIYLAILLNGWKGNKKPI